MLKMDLIISEIHADISGLNKILKIVNSADFKKKYGSFSRILNLGDVLERGNHPKQVLKKLKTLSDNYPLISVMGNHDEAFLYGRKVSGSSLESVFAHDSLTKKDLEFFPKNKDKTFGHQEFFDKKSRVLCVHGGPLDPKEITPENAGPESWLYEKSWQRLSNEEFFSYAGYHYKPISAFKEATKKIKNPIILCGHQHEEAALEYNNGKIFDILPQPKLEKISNFEVQKKSIPFNEERSYLIRIGLGGPEGYYGTGHAKPHFGILDHDQKMIMLFAINGN